MKASTLGLFACIGALALVTGCKSSQNTGSMGATGGSCSEKSSCATTCGTKKEGSMGTVSGKTCSDKASSCSEKASSCSTTKDANMGAVSGTEKKGCCPSKKAN
ncbi:MAG: hypothetical protein KF864_08970 [Phycisphaeraceae bacterium]|nr:hypothetical protein [Phycisphaeraceae bacterium]